MTELAGRAGSWLGATGEVLLAAVAFHVVWYPAVSLGNELAGAPLADPAVRLVVFCLALGGAYPVVAGGWSLGRVADYAFFLVVTAVTWGVVGLVVVATAGLELSGNDPLPQAVLWALAYPTAYLLAFRAGLSVFE